MFTKSLVILALSAIPFSALQAQTGMMEVVDILPGDSLNVRSGPGANHTDIGDLQPHEIVTVLGYDASGRWAQIRYRGQIAYVSASFLAETTRPDGSSIHTGPHRVTGIAPGDADGGLVVRDGAGINHAQIGLLLNDTVVHVIQRSPNGRWAMIAYGQNVGWVGTAYLQSQPLPQPAQPAPQTANGFLLDVLCRGTEPFWTLEFAADRTVTYTALIQGQAPLTSLTQTIPSAGGGYPFSFWAAPYSGVISSGQCSDGMSDLSYSMAIALSKPAPNGGMETVYGCCAMR